MIKCEFKIEGEHSVHALKIDEGSTTNEVSRLIMELERMKLELLGSLEDEWRVDTE